MDSLFLLLKLNCTRLSKLASAAAQARTGLPGAQAPALLMLSMHGPRRISDLARDLDLGKPAATTLVDRMEKAQLVFRQSDESDARISVITLTERGRAMAADVAVMIGEFDATLVGGLDEHEEAIVRRFLRRLSQLDTLQGKA
ncbi:MarR family winged helix-turn-helix transcriptional regulator [Oricola sp.]|uniref:MarR family winged helix-turn-helix transcriptional regulator n=1 Tax=Oricola sp. TaxID=1979950 RepID=UPI0025CBBB6E|nr:MarR family winged helix-turn-helix transcriptional regulator [Oricola sp.]MCI5077174.1 MarR family winged helix-turn-helix transcriptional regulator [Oricola sp.]